MITLSWHTAGFLALAFVALIAGSLLLYVRRRRQVARGFGDPVLLRRLVGTDLIAVPWARLLVVTVAALGIAMAFFETVQTKSSPSGPGRIVLVLDASGSMLVEDVGTSRLDLQRSVARRIADAFPNRPIGLVVFAGGAYALTPPTRDRRALEMYLSAVDPSVVTQSGSALGPAIRQGVGLAASDSGAGGTLVLLSDGGDTQSEESALDAAALAREQGVAVHVVGVGTPAGGPIPALDLADGTVRGTLLAANGEPIISTLDRPFLVSVAERGGGSYFAAGDSDLVEQLAQQTRASGGNMGRGSHFPRYGWLALAAFCLLLLEPVTARLEVWR